MLYSVKPSNSFLNSNKKPVFPFIWPIKVFTATPTTRDSTKTLVFKSEFLFFRFVSVKMRKHSPSLIAQAACVQSQVCIYEISSS